MQKKSWFSLATVLLLSSIITGCKETVSPQGSAPPLDNGTRSITLEITYDEFLSQQHISKQVELTYPGSLVVILGSNQTTGFQWVADANVGDKTVLSQYEHNFVSSTSTAAGAPGKDV